MNNENLGPAERIIQTLLSYSDHASHGRPGAVFKDTTNVVGVRWEPVTHKEENGQKVVYRLQKVGKKTNKVRLGVMEMNHQIKEGGHVVAEYRPAGLFPEVVCWMYRQVADVWNMDNEFAARWASYAFKQEHRDLKTVLAAFMLVQSRKGDPVLDGGKIVFNDEDFRDVGEAMVLLRLTDGKDLNPKLVLRIRDILALPGVAQINRELGFGKSARNPFFGRWVSTTAKWLRYREENVKMLDGLVKAGYRTTVRSLAQAVGYKPASGKFFQTLRWKQNQAKDGRRSIVIGEAVKAAESWEGLAEQEICERIEKDRPNFKKIDTMLPKKIGLTRAIMVAAVEAGCLTSKDLIIRTPTLEELGLLQIEPVKSKWEKAIKDADDQRSANIALRVKSKEVQEKLVEAADASVKKAVEEVMRDMRVYFFVDTSGSMEGAIEAAKGYIAKFLQGFPPDKVHVATFTTTGREVKIPHASAAGVENAFKGIKANGGTDYGAGVRALQQYKPAPGEDVLFVFVGDEEATEFSGAVRNSGLNPSAFGFLKTVAANGAAGWRAQRYETSCVRDTAANLGIPCFMISPETFSDVYAIPRTIRNLISATPVGKTNQVAAKPRMALVDTILKTELLKKPAWS